MVSYAVGEFTGYVFGPGESLSSRMNNAQPMKLSIIIAAWNDLPSLHRCLVSLEGQLAEDTEVIVASNYNDGAQKAVSRQFPFVRYVRLPADTTVPQLRAQGIRCSSGEIVALLEDHCTFDERWCAEIRKAHELPYSIIGGSVENSARQGPLDWAVYFYDYGPYMLPEQPRVATALTGANASYKRSALEEVAEHYEEGFYESFVHDELQRRGHDLYLMPSVIVYHQKNYSTKDALAQAYHHARAFAAKRILNAPLSKRAMFIMASLALPVLLPLRIAVKIFRKGRHQAELAKSLPYLLLLLSGWSIGEFCGYLCGEGDSAGKWK